MRSGQRSFAWITAICLVVCTAAVGVASLQRAVWTDAGDRVALYLEFNRLEQIAYHEGVPPAAALERTAAGPVTGLVVRERTLHELERQGAVRVERGWTLNGELALRGERVDGSDAPFQAARLYVHAPDPDLHAWLARQLARRWPYGDLERLTVAGVDWIGLEAPSTAAVARSQPVPRFGARYTGPHPEAIMTLPLGFYGADAALIAAHGLAVAFELLEPHPEWRDPAIRVEALAELPGDALLLVQGGRLLPGEAEPLYAWLAQGTRRLGVVWGQAEGLRALSERLQDRLVKVHPMWPGEPEQAIVTGVRERYERVLYYQRFLTLGDQGIGAVGPGALAPLAARLEAAGFELAATAATLRTQPAPWWAKAAACLAIALAWLMALVESLPSPRRPQGAPGTERGGRSRFGRLLQAIVVAGVAGALLLAAALFVLAPQATAASRMLVDVAALAAAVVFPVLGLMAAVRLVLAAGGRLAPWAAGCAALVTASAFSIAGGMLLHGLLDSVDHIAQTRQFTGVRVALVLPVVWTAVWAFSRRQALLRFPQPSRGRVQASGALAGSGDGGGQADGSLWSLAGGLLRLPLRVRDVFLAAVAAVVVAFVLMRSGNFPIIPVSELELAFRSWLEAQLVVRPRTKEFLFGHPLLWLLGAWAGASLRQAAAHTPALRSGWLWLVPAAAIGQTSLLNTFAHIHTPLGISLVRSAHGLWLGALLGALAWWAIRRLVTARPDGAVTAQRGERAQQPADGTVL